MILVRDVFQAKYGKGGDLVDLMKEAQATWNTGGKYRLLLDVSGEFFTVVTEAEFPDLAAWESRAEKIFAHPDFGAWFEKMVPLVKSGRREFYRIVE